MSVAGKGFNENVLLLHTVADVPHLMTQLHDEGFAGLVRGEAIQIGNGLLASFLTHVLETYTMTSHTPTY